VNFPQIKDCYFDMLQSTSSWRQWTFNCRFTGRVYTNVISYSVIW